jgi:hypothetical protein
MAEEQVAQEEVEQVQEEVKDDIQLPSDKADEEQTKEEETKQEEVSLDELKAKLEQQEEYIKKLKDEKSQNKREEKESERQQETQAQISEFSSNAIQEALEVGDFTEESLAKAEELGIDSRDLKLQLYEAKENLNSLYESAGGKDEYYNMVDAVKDVVSEAEVEQFKNALQNPEYANLAMYALKQKYSEVTGNNNTGSIDNRITTDSSGQARKTGVYNTEAEYFADRRAAMKLTGSDRNKAMEKIQSKLRKSSIGKQS